MATTVSISLHVSPEVAMLLRNKERARRAGKLFSELLRPETPASDPLAALIAEVKADARANGLTDAEIDADLAEHNAEHRPWRLCDSNILLNACHFQHHDNKTTCERINFARIHVTLV